MASAHSTIKQSIAELKTFFEYHYDDFAYAYREINRRYPWNIAYKPEAVYALVEALYNEIYEGLHPLLFDDNPAADRNIINRVTRLHKLALSRTSLFEDIAARSDENVLDEASNFVYGLVRQLQDKLPEVLNLIKRETAALAARDAASDQAAGPQWIGIVTAATEEFKAVRDLLPEAEWHLVAPTERDSSTYYEGTFARAGQSFRVVLVKTHHQGMVAASNTTTKLLAYYQPKLVAMLGYAAGNSLPGAGIGDVLVATESVDYQQVEVIERPAPDATDASSAGTSSTGPVVEEKDRKLRVGLNVGLKSQLEEVANLDGLLRQLVAAYPVAASFPESVSPRFGKFVTGAALLRSTERIAQIFTDNPGAIALDMEVQGFYYACEHSTYHPKPLFVAIKSISDFGRHKENYPADLKPPLVRQRFAAYLSARFFYEFLFRGNWQLPASREQ